MPTEPDQCPVCHSPNLTEAAPFASFDNHARFRSREAGLFGPKPVKVKADTARVCLDCGYLLLFVRQEDIDRLKNRFGKT